MENKYKGFLYPAYKDVLAIEALAHDIDKHCEVIAFHAQQAAEKILKNVLEENGIVPPKTYDIAELLKIAADKEYLKPTQKEIRAATHLSAYAVIVRYAD